MSALPHLRDLGRSTQVLLGRDYGTGVSVRATSRAPDGVNFESSMRSMDTTDPGKGTFLLSELGGTWKKVPWGVNVSGKIDTENKWSLNVSQGNKILQGLTLYSEIVRTGGPGNPWSNIVPATLPTGDADENGRGKGQIKLGGMFTGKLLSAHLDVEMHTKDALVSGSAVVSPLKGLFVGAQAWYRVQRGTKEGQLQKAESRVEFSGAGDLYTAGLSFISGGDMSLSYVHRLDSRISVGAQFSHIAEKKLNLFSLGAAYRMDTDTAIKSKVTSNGLVNLCLAHRISGYIDMTLSTELDGRRLDSSGITVQDEYYLAELLLEKSCIVH